MKRAPKERVHLNSTAINALRAIILTSVGGIIVLSFWGLTLRAGLLGGGVSADSNTVADEALSILGNIAAAAVGGLVGWLTRDYFGSKEETPGPVEAAEPAEPALVMIEVDEELTEPAPDHEDELDTEDSDLVWEDEPVDEDALESDTGEEQV